MVPFQTWYRNDLIVYKLGAEAETAGITYFGAWGVGFGIGIVVLAVVALVAGVAPERLSTPLSFAALGLVAILAADLVVIGMALTKARVVAGEGAASLAAAADSKVSTYVHSQGMNAGVVALASLGLVAVQLPWQDLAPRVLAGIPGTLGLLSVALPWVEAYVEVDGDLRVHRYWVFTAPTAVLGLGLGLLVVVGLAGALALLPRASVPVLVAATVVGLAVIAAFAQIVPKDLVEEQLAGQRVLAVNDGAANLVGQFASLLVAGLRLGWRTYRARFSARAGRSGPPLGHLAPPDGRPAPPGGRPAPPAR